MSCPFLLLPLLPSLNVLFLAFVLLDYTEAFPKLIPNYCDCSEGVNASDIVLKQQSPKPEVGSNPWSPDLNGYQASKIIFTHYLSNSFSFSQGRNIPLNKSAQPRGQVRVKSSQSLLAGPCTLAQLRYASAQRKGHLCVDQHRLALTILTAPALFLALPICILTTVIVY